MSNAKDVLRDQAAWGCPVGRRAFVGLAVAAGLGAHAMSRGSLSEAAAATPTRVAGQDPTTRRIAALGKAYLKLRPDEADKAFLLRNLPDVDTTRPVVVQLPALQRPIVDDFVAGRFVSVLGWQLAVTEARAAALVALGA